MTDFVYEHTAEEMKGYGIDPWSEDDLISLVNKNKNDYYILWEATIMLQKVGTRKSLELLYELIHYPKTDVRITSFYAISHILKEEGNDFYVESLENPEIRVKFPVLKAIEQYSNNTAVSAVANRAKIILSRIRKKVPRDERDMTELTIALKYLMKFPDEHFEVIIDLLRKKFDRLVPQEVAWIKENIPELAQQIV